MIVCVFGCAEYTVFFNLNAAKSDRNGNDKHEGLYKDNPNNPNQLDQSVD